MNKTEQIKNIILELPKSRFSVSDVNKLADASPALINNTLRSLVDKGIISKKGSGRNSIYIRHTNDGDIKQNEIVEVSVKDRFDFIAKFARMVGEGAIPSMLLTGQAGVGKSYTITNTLESMGLEEGDDYVTIKGHSSPMGLYAALYHNNGKILVFDDCDSIWDNASSINILKGALDSYSRRTISWQSLAAERNDLPDAFDFEGSVIFISNRDAQRLDSAVVSRAITCNLEMSNEEIVDRMDQLKVDIEPNIPVSMKDEVLNFLKEKADLFEGLSLRTFIQSIRIRKGCETGGDWQKMILYTLA